MGGSCSRATSLHHADQYARIRILHALPFHDRDGAVPVDVYLGGCKVAQNLKYGYLSDYVKINPGKYDLGVNRAGVNHRLAPENKQDFAVGKDYTVAIASDGRPNGVRYITLLDDNTPAVEGQARVRFVQTSAAAPVVNVWYDDEALFTNVAPVSPQNTVQPAYADVYAGPADITIRAPGTDLSGPGEMNFEDGAVYTLFGVGVPLDAAVPYKVLTATYVAPHVHAADGSLVHDAVERVEADVRRVATNVNQAVTNGDVTSAVRNVNDNIARTVTTANDNIARTVGGAVNRAATNIGIDSDIIAVELARV